MTFLRIFRVSTTDHKKGVENLEKNNLLTYYSMNSLITVDHCSSEEQSRTRRILNNRASIVKGYHQLHNRSVVNTEQNREKIERRRVCKQRIERGIETFIKP